MLILHVYSSDVCFTKMFAFAGQVRQVKRQKKLRPLMNIPCAIEDKQQTAFNACCGDLLFCRDMFFNLGARCVTVTATDLQAPFVHLFCCNWPEMAKAKAARPKRGARPKHVAKPSRSGKSGWKQWKEKQECKQIREGLERNQRDDELARLKLKLEAHSPERQPLQDSGVGSSGSPRLALPVVAAGGQGVEAAAGKVPVEQGVQATVS